MKPKRAETDVFQDQTDQLLKEAKSNLFQVMKESRMPSPKMSYNASVPKNLTPEQKENGKLKSQVLLLQK
jgi:hypothetical protein